MNPPRPPIFDPEMLLATRLKRTDSLRSLDVLHLFVGFVFYAFIALAVAMFAIRLWLDRGNASDFMLAIAIFSTCAAAVSFAAMLVVGMLRNIKARSAASQEDPKG